MGVLRTRDRPKQARCSEQRIKKPEIARILHAIQLISTYLRRRRIYGVKTAFTVKPTSPHGKFAPTFKSCCAVRKSGRFQRLASFQAEPRNYFLKSFDWKVDFKLFSQI